MLVGGSDDGPITETKFSTCFYLKYIPQFTRCRICSTTSVDIMLYWNKLFYEITLCKKPFPKAPSHKTCTVLDTLLPISNKPNIPPEHFRKSPRGLLTAKSNFDQQGQIDFQQKTVNGVKRRPECGELLWNNFGRAKLTGRSRKVSRVCLSFIENVGSVAMGGQT